MITGAVVGYVSTGTLEGAAWGAFSGAVFHGIGAHFGAGDPGTGFWGSGLETGGEFAAQAVSHAFAGGVIAEMQGGKFGHGFISAGVSKAATPTVTTHINGEASQAVTLAIVGGTVSKVTGGKFANGAITSAMAFAFNQQSSESKIDAAGQAVEILADVAEAEDGSVILSTLDTDEDISRVIIRIN